MELAVRPGGACSGKPACCPLRPGHSKMEPTAKTRLLRMTPADRVVHRAARTDSRPPAPPVTRPNPVVSSTCGDSPQAGSRWWEKREPPIGPVVGPSAPLIGDAQIG